MSVVLAVFCAAFGCVTDPVDSGSARVSDPDARRRALYGTPADTAPAALTQFGQLAGRWECAIRERNPDKTWRPRAGTAVWTWFYTLGGRAVQDIWAPRGDGSEVAAAGTNLRVYDPERDLWRSAWTSTDSPQFEIWEGSSAGGQIVLQTGGSERRAQISFFNIGKQYFDWQYELFEEGVWQAVLKTKCTRIE